MKIIVLGGAGLMGRIAVKDLAASEGVDQVVIADRDTDLAHKVADLIPAGRSKVSVVHTDVTDHEGLVSTLRGADAVLNAVHYYFNLNVMRGCLKARTHYTDLGGLFHNTNWPCTTSSPRPASPPCWAWAARRACPTSRPATPPTG